ncbi:hypothetical protein C8R44DRAFT_751886 [Mycena epipterygia]|nr:hypothetical protein C8R44DRAFT_751886 [Mycena epipterygia]
MCRAHTIVLRKVSPASARPSQSLTLWLAITSNYTLRLHNALMEVKCDLCQASHTGSVNNFWNKITHPRIKGQREIFFKKYEMFQHARTGTEYGNTPLLTDYIVHRIRCRRIEGLSRDLLLFLKTFKPDMPADMSVNFYIRWQCTSVDDTDSNGVATGVPVTFFAARNHTHNGLGRLLLLHMLIFLLHQDHAHPADIVQQQQQQQNYPQFLALSQFHYCIFIDSTNTKIHNRKLCTALVTVRI